MRKRAVEFGRRAVEGGSGSSGGGSELLPEAAEELLQKIFAVQSELPPALAESVAARTGCTPAAALAFFLELHASFKRGLRRLADSAADAAPGGPPSEEAALVAAEAGAAAREAALAKLRPLLDAATGGLRDASVTGQFASVMAGLSSNVVRLEAAHAVAASKRTVRAKLVATSGFLATLEGWLEEAREQEFYTLQRQLLRTLDALPLGAALLRGCTELLRAVRRLQEAAHPDVAAAAQGLAAKWQEALAASDGAAALPAGVAAAAAALPSWAAARSLGREPGAAGGHRPLPSAGVQSRAERSSSASGIGKQQERLLPAAAAPAPASQLQGWKQAGPQRQHAQQGQPAQQGQHAYQDVRPRQQQQQQQQQLPSQQQQQPSQQPPSQQQQQHSGSATTASRRSLQDSALFQKIRRSLAAAKNAAGPAPSSASGAGTTSTAGAPLGAKAGAPVGTPRVRAVVGEGATAPAPSTTQASEAGPESVRSQQQPQAAGGGEQEAASAAPARAARQKEQAPPPPPPLPPPGATVAAAAKAAVRAAPAEARATAAGSPAAGLLPGGGRHSTAVPAVPAGQAGSSQQPATGAMGQGPVKQRAQSMAAGEAALGAAAPPATVAQQLPHARPAQQAAPAASPLASPPSAQPGRLQALPHPTAPAGVSSPRAAPAAAAPQQQQQPHQQQQRQHGQDLGDGKKRQSSHRSEPVQRGHPPGASAPAAPGAAAGRAAKRARHPADSMREQTAWRAPPACAAAPAAPAAHGGAPAAPARGEDSSEAPALAAMRRAGRLPVCDHGGAPQEQVPAMPWWPLVPSEVREQKARLEAAGWRGWAA